MIRDFNFTTTSVAQTRSLAEMIGKRLRGDETLALSGDLGAGKTHFTQGLVAGAGSVQQVTSPTFVLHRIYKGSRFSINHFDAYRIDAAQLEALGIGDWLGKMVNVVEWGERVASLLPRDSIWIKIVFVDDTTREIKISCQEERSYLFE